MTRVKTGSITQKRHKKVLTFAKSFKGSHSKLFRTANQQVMKSYKYSYQDRRKKKNNFKKLWIQRINASARLIKSNYNKAMNKLKINKIILNKKILANLCVFDNKTFTKLIEL